MSRSLFGEHSAHRPSSNLTTARRGTAVALGTLAAVVVGSFAAGGTRAQAAGAAPLSRGAAAAASHSAVNVYAFVPPPVRQRTDITQFMNGLSNPSVRGMSWRFRWDDIEPSDGVYDWSMIDRALAADQGRPSLFRVMGGVQSPNWLHAAGARYEPAGSMPLPWDPIFLDRWTKFVAAYGARYDGNPGIATIETAGPGKVGETVLPRGAASWPGASDGIYVAAWERVLDAYIAAFPSTPVALDYGTPWNGSQAHMQLVAWATTQRTGRIWLQNNGLSQYANPKTLLNDARYTTTGCQMYGAATPGFGATPLPGSFGGAVNMALTEHLGYVEVYISDVTDARRGSDIARLASGW